MLSMFISELMGGLFQLFLFTLIPFIWWIITERKKEDFFKWIGLKKINHEGEIVNTLLITLITVVVYSIVTSFFIHSFENGVTAAGSGFAGKGMDAFPAVLIYGFIRTGLAEEIVFRGFLLKRISNKFGFMIGNTVQAILFGALHGIPFGIATHSIPVMVLMTLLPGAFGWYNGWLNEKRCGESIVLSWLLHGTMNVVVACLSL